VAPLTHRASRCQLLTASEHPAILEPLRFLGLLGAAITLVGVDSRGLVDPDDSERAIRPDTVLVSVMRANNEVGTIQPIAEIARRTRAAGVLLHTDAAQSVGKLPTRVDELGVDLLSIAGHRLYAPKGIGALCIRDGVALEPLLHGAGHESGRRAGTESALLDAALGPVADLAADLSWTDHVRTLRDRLWQGLRDEPGPRAPQRPPRSASSEHADRELPGASRRRHPGPPAVAGGNHRLGLPQRRRVALAGAGGEGREPEVGDGSVRFSLGRMTTTVEEIETVLRRLHGAVAGGRAAAHAS